VVELDSVEAVAFDFFDTLVFHRDGRGRGRVLTEYLEARGLGPAPWVHEVLYDVFELHDGAYSPVAPLEERERYYAELAGRVFEKLRVSAASGDALRHSPALWEILGPRSFEVFPDALDALKKLYAMSIPMVIISNWQSGLRHYCHELGIARFFDHIIGSADFGVAKPDSRIFREASRRLGIAPSRILHVGDSHDADYFGGEGAGFQVLLIDRASRTSPPLRSIPSLSQIVGLVAPR
jgi:HAD superfamily hydrolase (TIGR01549 family)